MPKYRYTGDSPRIFPSLGLDLEPGQEFESDEPIDHPDIVPVAPARASTEPTAAKE